jgi:hypothetical protein
MCSCNSTSKTEVRNVQPAHTWSKGKLFRTKLSHLARPMYHSLQYHTHITSVERQRYTARMIEQGLPRHRAHAVTQLHVLSEHITYPYLSQVTYVEYTNDI